MPEKVIVVEAKLSLRRQAWPQTRGYMEKLTMIYNRPVAGVIATKICSLDAPLITSLDEAEVGAIHVWHYLGWE